MSARIWITPELVMTPVKKTLKCQRIAEEVAKLAAKDASASTIAGILGQTRETVEQALDFIRTGVQPKAKPPGKRTGKGHPNRKSIDPVEVVRLREQERWSFVRIAEHLGVAKQTVTRLYDRQRPEQLRQSVEAGEAPDRGSYRRLPQATLATIENMLRQGRSPGAIAKEVGCGRSSVMRERKRLGLTPKP